MKLVEFKKPYNAEEIAAFAKEAAEECESCGAVAFAFAMVKPDRTTVANARLVSDYHALHSGVQRLAHTLAAED